MTIQVFTVEEGMAIKDNSGTTVFDVTNAGNMTVDGTSALQGATTFGSGGTAFTFPSADGSANQALITDGAGNVTWADPGAQYNFLISDGVTTQTIDDGETVLFSAGTGITAVVSATNTLTITNTGVTSNVAGTGISVSGATGAVTITNTGVTSAVAGTGISVSGATGAVTFTNSGVVSLATATGTSTGSPLDVSASTGALTLTINEYDGTTNVGYVPTGGSATTFLRGDGTWADPGAQYEWTLAGTSGSQTIADGTTVTFGGGTTGLTYAVAAGVGVTTAGTLAVGHGGTGQISYTDGQLLIGNSTGNTLDKATLTAGTGITITNGGGAITIDADNNGTVTSIDVDGGTTGLTFSGGPITTSGTITMAGTLAIANGGTGQTSAVAAFDALAPTTTKGDIIVYNGTDNIRLAVGTNGQALFADSTEASGVKWDDITASAGGNNTEVQFNSSGILAGDSDFTWDGTNLVIDSEGAIRLGDAAGTEYVGFQAPTTITASQDYVLPNNYPGTSGFVLSSTTGGVLSWISNDAADSAGSQYDLQFADGSGGFSADTTNEFQYNDTTTSSTATGEFILGKSRMRTINITAAASTTTTVETYAGGTYGAAEYMIGYDSAGGQTGVAKTTIATDGTVVTNSNFAFTTSDGATAVLKATVSISAGTVTVAVIESSGATADVVVTRTLLNV
jgi:hypothetical protein